MNDQPPYQNWSSEPGASQPSGPTYPSYPDSNSQGYGQPGAGYAPPPGYGQPIPGYGQPGFGYPQQMYPGVMYVQPRPDPGKGMAIAGFVLGIISICLLCLTTAGAVANLVVATLGIIFSALGRKSTTSRGLAIAGLVLSIIEAVASAIFFLVLIGILASFSHVTY